MSYFKGDAFPNLILKPKIFLIQVIIYTQLYVHMHIIMLIYLTLISNFLILKSQWTIFWGVQNIDFEISICMYAVCLFTCMLTHEFR
jgi:hypothetical protein